MENDLISVIDFAKTLGKHKAIVFKILGRLGIETVKTKRNDARGQKVSYITADDCNRVREYFIGSGNDFDASTALPDIGGVFYLIQLEPEHDPGRFKLGFATSMEERLRTHKTAAPFSKVLKVWPCKLLWEKTAIECAAQGCERIHTEVFRTSSIDAVLARCEQFFKLMPGLNQAEKP